MDKPLPAGIDLDTLEAGVYRCYAEDHWPLDPPTHIIQAVGSPPVTAWIITDRETGESRFVTRPADTQD